MSTATATPTGRASPSRRSSSRSDGGPSSTGAGAACAGARARGPSPSTRPACGPTADDATHAQGERIDLAAAIATLPRRLRDVVELGAIQGLPYHRVAACLGLPVGTVKSRMHHAVRRLRKVLGDDLPATPEVE